MKYILLAAGRGSRMGAYTETLPKTLLLFGGNPLFKHHLKYAKSIGAKFIMVKGYRADMINGHFVSYINKDYIDTNMVKSFILAREQFNDDVIVAYGDIVYNQSYLKKLVANIRDFVVTVDMNWEKYWMMRYGNLTEDTESLVMDEEGFICEIGKPVEVGDRIDARFVGLMKFSKHGLKIITEIYDKDPSRWKKAYMTDLLQELIDQGYIVDTCRIVNGWLEFDTDKDFEQATKWHKEGILKKELNLEI